MNYRLISVDDHLEHSPKLWLEYVPEQYRHYIEEESWDVSMPGISNLWLNMVGPIPPEQRGSWDHPPFELKIPGSSGGTQERLAEMNLDGVTASTIFGGTNICGHIPAIKRKSEDAYIAIIQAFNNFLSDFCAPCPERLLGVALIPAAGVDVAIEELRRVAKLPGIHSVVNLGFPNGSGLLAKEDDAFWAESIKLKMPISIHGSMSGPWWAGGIGKWGAHEFGVWNCVRVECQTGGPFDAANFVLSGVFDRFPELRFCVSECGASWVPFMACQLDNNYYRHRNWGDLAPLERMPSDYVMGENSHFLWNVIVDPYAIKYRHDIGVKNLVWASDFPHTATNWPRSKAHVANMLFDVPDEERELICWKNAAKWLNLI